MTHRTEHLTFEQLSDLAARDEQRHLHVETCGVCQATLHQVRELLVATHALPRELPPPPDVWSELRRRISAEVPVATRRARWWHNGWLASAAAIVLIVGTMMLTMQFRPGPVKAKGAVVVGKSVPAVLTAVDRNYVGTIRELRMALEAQHATLSPTTIRTVEHSLRVIDDAIAEARQALADDPANQMLAGILAAHYERQVDLLKRATQLSSSL